MTSRQKILCVDDQPANLVALEAVLDMPDVVLLKAASGSEALQVLLENEDIALALLDVQMAEMDGYEVAELMRSHPRSRDIPIIFLTAINKDIRHVFRGYESGAVDYLLKPLEPAILRSKVRVFLDLDNKTRQLQALLKEVRTLRDNHEALLRSVGEGIIGVDLDGLVTFANPVAARMAGLTPGEAVGRRFLDLVHLPGLSPHEAWASSELVRSCLSKSTPLRGIDAGVISREGSVLPVEGTASVLHDAAGRADGISFIFQDVSERRAWQERLVRLAEYDSLTGLANRHLCLTLLGQALARAARNHHPVGLLFLDLDRFKQVNDTLGHAAGDQLLRDVASRLRHATREGDTVCRLGGDEFVIVVEGLHAARNAAVVADKIIHAIAEPFLIEDHAVHIGTSIGIVTYPETPGDAHTLLRHADIAMYRAKSLGRGNFQFFTPEMQEDVLRHQRMEQDLRDALASDRFVLWYQPQVSAVDGTLRGIEALVRWQSPDGRLLEPDDFLPLAEETGLIVPLGEWVLRTACEQAAALDREGLLKVPLAVSVNLSIRQVRSAQLLDTLSKALSGANLKPGQLVLEITEQTVIDDPDRTIGMLNQFRALGLSIALDDFGVGYSSFAQIKRMPLDAVKIDRSLIVDVIESARSRDVVRAIANLGHSLGLQVVAEAVEREGQVPVLRDLGVDVLQGYACHRPMAAADIRALLSDGANGLA